MSSFWTSIRSRKNSSSAGETEITKPPSGRSSKCSRSSKTVDDDLQRQDSDDKAGKGCIQISCLAGQGLSCKALSSKLKKVQKNGSSRSESRNDIPPTPLPTPEPDTNTNDYPGLSPRPPIPDSPKPKIKGFRKRAASASPSRYQSEKRKMFRGLSKERMITPLRNLFKSRQSQSKPDISLVTDHPIKPLRKPGPLGRSWVKVFSDIPFVDDASEENYPILGHTGYPAKLPDAEPLPIAPTPPPQKVKIYDVVIEDIKPQKDVLLKDQLQNISDASDEQQVILKKTEQQVATDLEKTCNDFENIEQNKVSKSSLDSAHINSDSHGDESEVRNKFIKMERPSRNRDAVRHKAKRAKRSGTPIGINTQLPSPEEVAAAQCNSPKIADISSDEIMEDGYICSQNLNPPKPPRVAKMYDKVFSSIETVPKDIESSVMNVTNNEVDICESEINQVEVEKYIPGRPKRGNKIYENLKNKTNHESNIDRPSIINDEDNSQLISQIQINLDNTIINCVDSVISEPPPKPKRSPKVYENLKISHNPVEQSDIIQENVITDDKLILSTNPSKPNRGNKVNRNSSFTNDIILRDKAIVSNFREAPETKLTNISSKNTDSENKENMVAKANGKHKSPYSTVCKDRVSKELKEITPCRETFDIPPPIPPKNKNIKSLENTPLHITLINPSTKCLSSKTRSADTSPSRPRRKRLVAQINKDLSPTRPNRPTKVYTEFQIIRTSNNEKQTENIKEYNTDVITKRKISSREFRQSCPLPPPPRPPKKSPNIQKHRKAPPLLHDKENSPSILSTESVSCVPGTVNNALIKSSIIRKNRPPPPPPPNLKGKLHGVQLPNVSKNDLIVHPESRMPNIAVQSTITDSLKLNSEIDMNLKNIDHSFETLDSVIHSLRSYVTLPPAWTPERTKRRLSCDVVCDQGTEVCHSINQNASVVSDVNLIHNSGSGSRDQFTNADPDVDIIPTCGIVDKYNDSIGKTDSGMKEDPSLRSKEEACELEIPPKVEFLVTIPSIISMPDDNVSSNNGMNKLSCVLNIKSLTTDTVDITENIESVSVVSPSSPSSLLEPLQEGEITNVNINEEYDPKCDILEQYEGDIKAISKELNVLKSTLERCESEYSEDTPTENEGIIVGTLLLGAPSLNKESSVPVIVTSTPDIKVNQFQETTTEDQLVSTSEKLEIHDSYSTISNRQIKSEDVTSYDEQKKDISLETSHVTYSFQENLHKNRKPSPENKRSYSNFPEAALAMERVLESVTTKSMTKSRQIPICLENQEEDPSQTSKEGLKISDNTNCQQAKPCANYPSIMDSSTTNEFLDRHNFDNEIEESDYHMPNIDYAKDQELIEEDSSEEASEASSCTVEEIKTRSDRGREQNPDDSHKCESITEESNVNTDTNTGVDPRLYLADEKTPNDPKTDQVLITSEQTPHSSLGNQDEDSEVQNILEDKPSTSQLLHGVADITGKLEGIRSQLEAVISNYIPPTGVNDASFDYASSESYTSSLSNRSSLTCDPADSSSNASFYSLSQPSLSNYSILSYYTARSGPSPALSDSSINTPAGESLRGESDDYTDPDLDDHAC